MGWWSRVRASLQRSREPDPKIRLLEGGFDVVSPVDGRRLAETSRRVLCDAGSSGNPV
jgi:hypothetical protein